MTDLHLIQMLEERDAEIEPLRYQLRWVEGEVDRLLEMLEKLQHKYQIEEK